MKRNNSDSSSAPYRLGDLLIKQQLITPTQLQQALQQQAASGEKLGTILLHMGAISSAALSRTLSKQRWLRPCAACIALMSPMSACFASDVNDGGYHQWSQNNQWIEQSFERVSDRSSSIDLMKFAAETAWDIYQGEPEAGEWRYSLSQQQNSDGYSIEMTMHF